MKIIMKILMKNERNKKHICENMKQIFNIKNYLIILYLKNLKF